MLYRCDFDVRIIQKFATTFSRTPYFYRMDLFLGHLQFCVTDEQVATVVGLKNVHRLILSDAFITFAFPDSYVGSAIQFVHMANAEW